MININSEILLTLSQAARTRPPGRGGRPTHPSTVYRWIVRGIRGCRLEAVRLGGTTYTSAEALQRFAERLTQGPTATSAAPAQSKAQRERQARIAQELDQLGL